MTCIPNEAVAAIIGIAAGTLAVYSLMGLVVLREMLAASERESLSPERKAVQEQQYSNRIAKWYVNSEECN